MATNTCDMCTELLDLLETYEERCQSGGFQMTKNEVFVFINYIFLWPQRQCMYCFKSLKNFERLNNMVQLLLSIAIRIIQTFPEDCLQQIQIAQKNQNAIKNGQKTEHSHIDDESMSDMDVEAEDLSEAPHQWTLEEKEKLLNVVTKIFLTNFPVYMAYKHVVQSSLEELSAQETSALNNYCETSDPDLPLYLLRNVCFFCDSNGIGALKVCFEKGNPETLPFNIAHILISLIANLRMWMNIPTVMQCIVPLRTSIIRYMCKLSDKDLRMAGSRNMTDLMWAAVKEPLETHFTFDKEGLDLAFKYFTCSTLTIRLAGIAQINNQINMYNESSNSETAIDSERVGHQLSDWLMENKIIEHIFGPNLHVEIIKQCQLILNLLAMELKITNEHIDLIWSASQLKHCSKQVYDILIPLIKNLDLQRVQYLLRLVSALEPSVHSESTLYLASALIKCIWNTCAASQTVAAVQQQQHANLRGAAKSVRPDISSSESIQLSDEGDPSKNSRKGKHYGPRRRPSHAVKSVHVRGKQDESMDSEDVNVNSGESDIDPTDESEEEESPLGHHSCHHHHHGHGHHQHHHHRQQPVQQRSQPSEASESEEIEESSEEEIELEDGEVMSGHHFHRQRFLNNQRQLAKAQRHRVVQQKRQYHNHPSHIQETSEEEEEEEELEDSEFLDESEDEEILKEAKLVELKHCRHDSEDNSELEEESSILHDRKMTYHLAQRLLAKPQLQQQQYLHQLQRQQKNPQFFQQGLPSHKGKPCMVDPKKEVQTQIDQNTNAMAGANSEQSVTEKEKQTENEAAALQETSPEISNSEVEQPAEVFDCTSFISQAEEKKKKQAIAELNLSQDEDGSCHSSHISTKSEKNMADFEGEDFISDEELASIDAYRATHNQHQHQHLAGLAMYTTRIPQAVIHHCPPPKEVYTLETLDFTFDDVCMKGNTLLWDLVQEDSISLLPEGLALEAEKALCNLVCYSTDRRIKTKFIEACVNNVASHRSVVVSLRLLHKIFSSFHQYRSGTDTQHVTMWAEKELNMMKHVFDDLVYYAEKREQNPAMTSLYSHKEQIQTRLMFLTCVFSAMGSPDNFRLNLRQINIIWDCVALDTECSDECLNWFLNQVKGKDHHAMGIEAFKHIFIEKMPQLQAETMSMIGLNLFQHLSHQTRIANSSIDNPLTEDQVCGINQLWNIALRASNTEVSISAIQILNSYYINYGNGQLDKEEEFIKRCMDQLVTALNQLKEHPETNLLVIQRGLVLLKNHLEAFKRRYAFHLRNWMMDGKGIRSHQRNINDKHFTNIKIQLQPAGMTEKATLEMSAADTIAELRAEVTRWWENLQKQQFQRHQSEMASGNTRLSQGHGAMSGDGPIRMITLGKELTVDMDEKTLGEIPIKDLQIVYLSICATRQQRKLEGCTTPSSCLPAPAKEKLPVVLLTQEPHFSKLFMLLEQLGNCEFSSLELQSQERWGLETKARTLSRKVWELLMLLPTNQGMMEGFKGIVLEECNEKSVDWDMLLSSNSPHKLMYSLQIVEALSRTPKHRRKFSIRTSLGDSRAISVDSDIDPEPSEEIWSQNFIKKGGLKHLLDIFKSGTLQAEENKFWSQWNQECLAYLLRMISQFSVELSDAEAGHDDVFESYESPRKKMRCHKGNAEKIIIPRINQSTLAMLNVDTVLKILMQILYDAAVPSDSNPMTIGTWGRTEVVHYSLLFLVSWAYSSEEVQQALCSSPNFTSWLKRLTLEAPEPFVRREACMGLYRLCLGRTAEGRTGYSILMPTLMSMLNFLPKAQEFKPHKRSDNLEPEKEPQGPGCRDYFWLVCRFVDNIAKEDAEKEKDGCVNLNKLAEETANYILKREYLETRQGFEEDDALVGLLNLMTAIIKHSPTYKTSTEGQNFLQEVFWLLFALPTPVKRYLPKCKSSNSRSSAYDLIVEFVKGSLENYIVLHTLLMKQHSKDSHAPYPWDYWPHEDGRSKCGYVGLTNLGATCYMATCVQHLYMLPQARQSVLQAYCTGPNKFEGTLSELKKMFAYLQESERKAYNPKSFCKTYTMDKQPLNTGEQKDMAEFFTDLISKLEDMSPEMRKLVKCLFGGIITNNVVSLDCPHVSRTLEEFYTVRCQVTDRKNLYESLDEVTVKDMLEGDNMYTCSKCQKKVRAEKRACFKKLPRILCFNTMRYTFNMVTMMKEKVNTHFSFPLRLDMKPYMETTLMGSHKLAADENDDKVDITENESEDSDIYDYELTGVTVHTGTADGGHYYSFIRDRLNTSDSGQDKWYLFNDAEVKPFDPCQIDAECFGGEMTSKTYDSVTDKFMDFSFEKTNSAYMLFYERCAKSSSTSGAEDDKTLEVEPAQKFNFELSNELEDWIWQDNMQFIQDKNIFEHTYFGFLWEVCWVIPTTLPKDPSLKVSLMASQLGTSFVLETLIHSKEKPTIGKWIELLSKQFNSCQAACEWFLDHMAESDWWPQQILIKCPNQMVRQMLQRLLIHVISQLRPAHVELYLQPYLENEDVIDAQQLGTKSCVTRFIRKMLSIIDHGARPHSKYLTEYFAFLFDFARLGDEECLYLIHTNAISTMVSFYMGQKDQENYVEIQSDDEEEEVITITEDTYKPLSLEKMIHLIAHLVDRSRGVHNQLNIPEKEYSCIIGGKGFPFLFNQIRDGINLRQSCNLIISLSQWNEQFAIAVVQMMFSAIRKLNNEQAQPFFKVLTMLVEISGAPPEVPSFINYILQRFWELTKSCPQACLEWMSQQVIRNKLASHWVLSHMDAWVEPYLLAHTGVRVRNAAAVLLVSLVPSNHFRQTFISSRRIISPQKEFPISSDGIHVLHQIYKHLLNLLQRARMYADAQHQTTRLLAYFTVLQYCLISREEKLMFSKYFLDLWNLFHPRMCEPQISMHHDKQALLYFWYQVCQDCPENVKLIVGNPGVCKQIAYNYILADHEDQDVVAFNRIMLPSYYGLLRMCCQYSKPFTRQLSQHQNIPWAFKNIAPYPGQYTVAVDELFKIMKLMATKYPEYGDEENRCVNTFKKSMLQMFLNFLDARSMWQTLISALRILVDTPDDRLTLIYDGGLSMITEAFNTLHAMYHEATACHVTGDIVDLLQIICPVIQVARHFHEKKGASASNILHSWKERMDFVRKLLTLLNSYTPADVRQIVMAVLKEMILTFQSECVHTIVPILREAHTAFQESSLPMSIGPYFPKRGQKLIGPKSNIRPPRPQFNMMLHASQLECAKGVDEHYDQQLNEFFMPYHALVDLLCRVAVNHQSLTEPIITLSAMVAIEGVQLHSPYFAKLWYEIYHSEVDRKCINILCNSTVFIEYVDSVLLDERLSLINHNIYQFFCTFFPKVYQQVLNDQGRSLLDSLVASVTAEKAAAETITCDKDFETICSRLNGDLRAMLLIFSVQHPKKLNALLVDSLQYLQQVGKEYQQKKRRETIQWRSQRKRSGSQENTEENLPQENNESATKKRRLSSEKTEATSPKDNTEAQSKPDTKDDSSDSKQNKNRPETDTEKKTVESQDQTVMHSANEKNSDDKRCSAGEASGSSKDDAVAGPSGDHGRSSLHRQNSGDSRTGGGEERPRERQTTVDCMVKHIESLFSFIEHQL